MPPVPWRRIFTSIDVWGTALAYVGFGYAATIFSTWFFIYLKDGLGFDLKSSAVLGMLPLTTSVFWGPMAVALMGGLTVATLLTLLFVPALYAICFRVKAPAR